MRRFDGRRKRLLFVSVLVMTALITRALPTLTADTPSGDGALFYAMTRDIRDSGQIPLYASFNGGYLPFVYPPGALVATAAISALGVDLDTLYCVLPLVYYALLTVAVFAVARWHGCDEGAATVATLLWVAADQLPFQQLIGGGGVVRGLGFLLALAAWRLIDTGRWQYGGIVAGLALWCHPSNAALLPILALSSVRNRRELRNLVLAGLIAAAITLPYLGFVILNHGVERMIYVLRSTQTAAVSNDSAAYLLFTVTGYRAPYVWARVLAPLAIIGLQRNLRLSLVFVALVLLPGQAYQVSFVFAVLCGLGAQAWFDFVSQRFSPPSRWLRSRLPSSPR